MNSDSLSHLWYFAPAWMEKFDAKVEDSRLEWHIKNLPLEVHNHLMAFRFGERCVKEPPPQNEVLMWTPAQNPGGIIALGNQKWKPKLEN
jgi:hypothetical protein